VSNGSDLITNSKQGFNNSEDGVGGNNDHETNDGVGDVFLGRFDLLSITPGSNVVNAAHDHVDKGGDGANNDGGSYEIAD